MYFSYSQNNHNWGFFMSLTIAEIDARIASIRSNIEAAEYAVSYGKGDKQVARQSLIDLQNQLARYLRDKRQMVATAAGCHNPGIITASFTR